MDYTKEDLERIIKEFDNKIIECQERYDLEMTELTSKRNYYCVRLGELDN